MSNYTRLVSARVEETNMRLNKFSEHCEIATGMGSTDAALIVSAIYSATETIVMLLRECTFKLRGPQP